MVPDSDEARPITLTPVYLFIIAVLVIESAMRLLPEGFMTRTLQHRAEEIRYLPAAPIQLMGDSVSSGIHVGRLQEFVGIDQQISNYSLPGTSPMFNYFVLRRQLAGGHKPKVIVFAPHPCTWREPFVDRFLARFANPRESTQLLRDGVDFSDWFYGMLCRASYTLRYREELYLAVTQGDRRFFRTWENLVPSVQNTSAKIEPAEAPPTPPGPSKLDWQQLPPSLTAPISIHPYNRLYFEKFCRLADQNGIRIVWLTLPEPQVFRDHFAQTARTAAYAPFLHAMQARHKNLQILSAEIPVMPDNHYSDAWHMNRYGAWTFARQAGQQLSTWLQAQQPLR
jgi:hypothetical protein